MSILEYNIRFLSIHILGVLSAIILGFILVGEGQRAGWFANHFIAFKRITLGVSMLVSIILLLYTIAGTATEKNVCVVENAQVTEIINQGSFGGWHDTFCVEIESNGERIEVQTVLSSSVQLRKKMEKIVKGDIVNIQYVRDIDILFNIEESILETHENLKEY